MLNEYKNEVEKLKIENPYFAKLVEKHAELDKKAKDADDGRLHLDQFELDKIKKEKLRLTDEALSLILKYWKEQESK